MTRRWGRDEQIKAAKNLEWCKENNLTLDFRRGKLYIYDDDGELLAEGGNINKAVKKLRKKNKQS